MSDSVCSLWREWYRVVQGFVLGNPPCVDDLYYKDLHRSLLKALRDQAAPPSNGPSDLFGRLQSLVEPWLALHTLASTDRKTLVGLWQTCLPLDAHLARPRKRPLLVYGMWSLVCVLFLGLVAHLLVMLKAVPLTAADWFWRALQSHPLLVVAVSIPLVILSLIALLAKLARNV